MPSLTDSLDALRTQSEQIAYLSSLNARPAGPFVQAYLGIPTAPHLPQGNVLDLIRDAQDSERRLFKFVGEADTPGITGGGNKRVEKREGGVVTPLKELKKRPGNSAAGSGKDDTEVMLKTAMKLVDDYRPMPRARAHITNLLDAHYHQAQRLAELERLIAEATAPRPARQTAAPASAKSSAQTGADDTPKTRLSPEEAIKAEDAALRALEASLQPLRRAAPSGRRTPSPSASSSNRSTTVSPPASRSAQVQSTPFGSRTPASGRQGYGGEDHMRTPGREMPHVTNSLVNGMTPRRIDRFSPLKFLGTPRASIGGSALRNVVGGTGGDEEKRTIFGRSALNRSTSGAHRPSQVVAQTPGQTSVFPPPTNSVTPVASGSTPAEQPEIDSPDDEEDRAVMEDETIRLPRPASPPQDQTPLPIPAAEAITLESPIAPQNDEDAPQAASNVAEPEDTGPRQIAGIEVDAEGVKAGVAKVWSTLGEMMRQGLSNGQVVDQDVESSLCVNSIRVLAEKKNG